jgi:hypothetical protein
MISQRKLFTQILCRFIFSDFMIRNKEKIFQFLFDIAPDKIYKGIYLFSSNNIGVLFRAIPENFLRNIHPDILWLTPSKRIFRKYRRSCCSVYFIRKERDKYAIYERRDIKTANGIYLLPPVAVSLISIFKTEEIRKIEEEYFAFQKKSNFFLEGDSLFRLGDLSYIEALDRRKKTLFIKNHYVKNFFSFCFRKLDR